MECLRHNAPKFVSAILRLKLVVFRSPMPDAQISIAPNRSLAFFAFLSIFMVGASYLLLLLLAIACVYLPYLLLLNIQTLQMQVILLFLGGIAVAATMLWSLFPRRDKFAAPSA